MDFISRGRETPPSTQHPVTSAPSPTQSKRGRKMPSGLMRWLGIALVVIVIVALIWVVAGKLTSSEQSIVESDQYQAVFLTNNQVYFGKITQMNDTFLVLEDVFYIETPTAENQTSSSNTNYTLRKLGANELHSPEDKMVINREQMTFWENLKDDGQVVTKINEYKANPDAANQQTTPTTQQPSSGSENSGNSGDQSNP